MLLPQDESPTTQTEVRAMKTLLTICALAAGAGLTATTNSASADHNCPYAYRGGYRYTAPVFTGGPRYHAHRHDHRFDRGFYSSRRFDRGWGYGPYDRGFYGRRGGFAIQTPGFGLYIR
jgi:hypothetical protein